MGGHVEAGADYKTENLIYYGLVRSSVRNGGALSFPMVFGVLALLIKLALLNAFLFKFFVNAVPNEQTWAKMFTQAPQDRLGALATLFLAPAYLLKKLASTSEFKQTATFRATLDHRIATHGDATVSTMVLLTIHSLSVHVLLPFFCFANSALVAFNADYYRALGSMFGVGLVLEVDEYMFWFFERLTEGKLPKKYSTVVLSPRTRALCEVVASRTSITMALAQATLIVMMKFESMSSSTALLWAIPVISLALRLPYLAFAQSKSELNSSFRTSVIIQAVMMLAFACLYPLPTGFRLVTRLIGSA